MRQSTLVFGGGSGSGKEAVKDDADYSASLEEEQTPPSQKRTRRAAAQKSQEQTKRQSQMILGENGRLNRQMKHEDRAVIVSDSDSEVEKMVRPSKRIVSNGTKAAASATSKSKEPISFLIKGTQRDPKEVTHSFFEKRFQANKDGNSRSMNVAGFTAPIRQRWNQGKEAPWPDSSNVHILPEELGSSSMATSGLLHTSPKRSRSSFHIVAQDGDMLPWQSNSYASTSKFQMVPDESPKCVKITEFGSMSRPVHTSQRETISLASKRVIDSFDKIASQKSGIMWVDQWRPLKAEQVLGNEDRAIQLRDWLNDLRVIADNNNDQVRKKIVRRKKKIRKAGGDDFIVDDDEEDEAWYDHFRKPDNVQDFDRVPDMHDSEASLSNAMLLTGPTGSGKTAAVYACAAELGFEVFEIYPGQGRRSGKDIAQAVGDLGRNHMVSSGGTGGGSTWKGFKIAKSDTQSGKGESVGKMKAAPRQSLILLEEVDLLFEEDKGFWAAVIELIATSKRPVIMTCNHTYSIPFESMLLQDTLRFEPPATPLAVDYLKTLAEAHGVKMEDDQIETLYKSTRGNQRVGNRLLQVSIPSSGVLSSKTDLASIDKSCAGIASNDLRQAITQLQYLCQSVSASAGEGIGGKLVKGADPTSTHQAQELRKKTIRTIEMMSFCDYYLTRPSNRERELLEADEYEYVNKPDDVQSSLLTPLPKVRIKLENSNLAEFGREEEYHFALTGSDASHSEEIEMLTEKRIKHSVMLLEMMGTVSSTLHYQISCTAIVTDYTPIIDNMIKVDDIEQEAWKLHIMQAVQEVNSSRNSPNEDDTDNLKAARSSLLQLGIRPSRHTTRLLLEKGSDGLLSLARKDSAPYRWINAEEELLDKIRCNRFIPLT